MSKPSVRSSTPYATASKRPAVIRAAPASVCAGHLTRIRSVRYRRNPSPPATAAQHPENAGSIPAASIIPANRGFPIGTIPRGQGQLLDALHPIVRQHPDWFSWPERDVTPEDIEQLEKLQRLEREGDQAVR
jgi:hypothetical protein